MDKLSILFASSKDYPYELEKCNLERSPRTASKSDSQIGTDSP